MLGTLHMYILFLKKYLPHKIIKVLVKSLSYKQYLF